MDTVVWRASETPCVSPYVPYRLCITRIPETYEWRSAEEAEATHYAPSADDFTMKPEKYLWLMRSVRYLSDFDYAGTHGEIYSSIAALERELDEDLETETDRLRAAGSGKQRGQSISEAASEGFERRTRMAGEWAKETFVRLGDARVALNRDRYKHAEEDPLKKD